MSDWIHLTNDWKIKLGDYQQARQYWEEKLGGEVTDDFIESWFQQCIDVAELAKTVNLTE